MKWYEERRIDVPTGVYLRKPITWLVNENGCHICNSHARDKDGYINVKRQQKSYKLHRLVYEERYGKISEGLYVCHKCDTPSCINPDHLFLGTNAENTADKVKKGRQSRNTGEKSGTAKLTWDDVKNIRADNRNQRVIAKEYGVCFQSISGIKNNKTWKEE
jgi:hypothetical protein